MAKIAVIDISCWLYGELPNRFSEISAAQRYVSRLWDEALRTIGAIIITGHGIPSETFDILYNNMHQFFSSRIHTKLKYHHGGYGNSKGGYTPCGLENVAASMEKSHEDKIVASDPVESFVFNKSSPYLQCSLDVLLSIDEDETEFMSTFIENSRNYMAQHMERILKALHYISAAALEFEDLAYFHNYYDDGRGNCVGGGFDSENHNGNALRLAYYPSSVERLGALDHSSDTTSLRYGAHTDYQGYTILKPDPQDWQCMDVTTPDNRHAIVKFGGLEVLDHKTQTWFAVSVPPSSNGLVVNAGDFLQRWTNDRWISPIHRVVGQPQLLAMDDDSENPIQSSKFSNLLDQDLSRKAIVFFSGPVQDVLIETVGSVSTKYEAIKAGDHLKQKLGQTQVMHSSN